MMWARYRLGAALALLLCLAHGPAPAARELTLEGLTFSDEMGGVELLDGWGSGTLDDPIVLVESITGTGPATLAVSGMTWRFGNRIRSHHEIGFALTKIVRNDTAETWSIFNLELREFIDYASPFDDGLSFGQASLSGRPFRSDRFVSITDIQEPYDGISFSDAMIAPGEEVTISFVITDTTPRYDFYLLQRRDSPISERAAPGAARLAGR
jgi:hypothetical protein